MPLPDTPSDARRLALDLFAAAVRGADAGLAVQRALDRETLPPGAVRLLAVGKAAPAMGAAAVRRLRDLGRALAGGLVVGAEPSPPLAGVETAVGDHPVPGPRSLAAGERVGAFVERVRPDD